MRAAIYTRVSTKHQAKDGFSLREQRERLQEIADANGWDPRIFEDAGISGETLDGRPAMLALLAEVRAGHIDVVLVMDESRLSRDNFVGGLIRNDLKNSGVRLVTPSGERDLTIASEELTSVIIQATAAYEQRIRTEKSRAGQARGAAEGYWMGGPPPFGYRCVEAGSHTRLAIDDSEAEVILRAVALVVDEGLSTWETCHRLNAAGMHTRRGRKWLHQNLRRHLRSEALKGLARWAKGTPDETLIDFPGLLDAGRWEQLQAVLDAVAIPNRAPRNEYPLSGRLFSTCGSHMYGTFRKDRGVRQYRCFRSQSSRDDRCDCKWRPMSDQVEKAVWSEVVKSLSEPERLLAMAEDHRRLREAQEPLQRSQSDSLAAQVQSLERAYARALTEYARAGLDGVSVRRALTDLQDELDAARKRLAHAQEWDLQFEQNTARLRSLQEIAGAAKTRLLGMSLAEQKQVLALLDVRVRVTTPGSRRSSGAIEVTGVLFESLLGDLRTGRAGGERSEGPRPGLPFSGLAVVS